MQRLTPALFVAALAFGVSTPALADVESGTPKEDMPKEDGDKDEAKSSGCSVQSSKLGLAGFAGLVLLVSGATLRRRD